MPFRLRLRHRQRGNAGVISVVISACVATELERSLAFLCLQAVQQLARLGDESPARCANGGATQHESGPLFTRGGGGERIDLLHAPDGPQSGTSVKHREAPIERQRCPTAIAADAQTASAKIKTPGADPSPGRTFLHMADLALELEHLAEADRHIAIAQEEIAKVAQQIASNDKLDLPTGEGAALLATMNETLKAFEEHRALIVSNIEDIRSGKL
jgi:hypothetical protein